MATTYNGVNYARAYVTSPSGLYGVGEYNGHEKMLFDEFTFAAELVANDLIRVGKLPKGARVTECTVKAPALTAGSFSAGHTGYAANADGTIAAKAADAAGFLAATDFSAAAQGSGIGVDILFQFLAPTEVQLKCTTTSTGATGLKIQTAVKYVVD